MRASHSLASTCSSSTRTSGTTHHAANLAISKQATPIKTVRKEYSSIHVSQGYVLLFTAKRIIFLIPAFNVDVYVIT